MVNARILATSLAIGVAAGAPAFAAGDRSGGGGGASWNTGFQPTFNTQEYGNQGPTGLGPPKSDKPADASNAGKGQAGKVKR